MDFDLTDLRLLVATADEGSLTRAAAARHLSLAAASARIKALEGQASIPLLYREARGVRLTPAGEAFLHHARAVLRQSEQLQGDLQAYAGGLRGHVRVFANTTAVTDVLPEILAAFLRAHAQVNVDLREKPNPEIARGVLDGRADLGIVAGPVDTLGLRRIHFSTDRLVLVVPRGHALARRRRVAFAETLAHEQVGMHEGSTLQAFLLHTTAQLGRPLRLRVQLASFDAICRMVGAGVGIAVVPESAAARHLAPHRLVQIALDDAWAVRERHVLLREREALPAPARSLLALLLDHHRVPLPADLP
jgi:DNA-binding transcriptional LysR family regulator